MATPTSNAATFVIRRETASFRNRALWSTDELPQFWTGPDGLHPSGWPWHLTRPTTKSKSPFQKCAQTRVLGEIHQRFSDDVPTERELELSDWIFRRVFAEIASAKIIKANSLGFVIFEFVPM